MKRIVKRILPIFLVLLVLLSIGWYLFVYDTAFTRDFLVNQARYFDNMGNHSVAAWLYDLAYRQSGNDDHVAIELAEHFKANGNYSKAEYTLSNAIAEGGSVDLYIALCKTYVEQDKLRDAVTMLDYVLDPDIKAQLDAMRPKIPTADPTPGAGIYNEYISVSVSAESGALYVSTDGEYPSSKEDLYTGSFTLQQGENIVYAVAVNEQGLVSPLAVMGYTVMGIVEEVEISDDALDALVRKMLGKDADDVLLTSDLWTITSLTMPQSTKDYTQLKYFSNLTSLTVAKGSFTNLQALSALTQLTKLSITDTPVSNADLAIIAGLPNLEDLTLSGCMLSSIQSLSDSHNLKHLDLSNNTIRDLSALSLMSNLQELYLSHNALTNLSYLSALSNLTKLDVSYNSLASVLPLAELTQLTDLDVSHNSLGNLNGLESLENLSKLNVSYNNLTEVDLLAGNAALTDLNISNNTILDIAKLSELRKLQSLDFSYNEITTIPRISSLIYLKGSHNKISSISPLKNQMQINTVILDYNKIKNVDDLATCQSMVKVDVSGNPVKNVSKLEALKIKVIYTP